MKKPLAVCIASLLALSVSTPVFAAGSVSNTDSESVSQSAGSVQDQVTELLKGFSPADAMTSFALVDPARADEGLEAVYTSAPDSNLADLVVAAFVAAPNRALAIASMAIKLGLDPALLPEFALTANIDPTAVSVAAAAGGETTTTGTRRTRGGFGQSADDASEVASQSRDTSDGVSGS